MLRINSLMMSWPLRAIGLTDIPHPKYLRVNGRAGKGPVSAAAQHVRKVMQIMDTGFDFSSGQCPVAGGQSPVASCVGFRVTSSEFWVRFANHAARRFCVRFAKRGARPYWLRFAP